MSEDLINRVVDTPAVKKQLDALYDQLQKVVQKIMEINQAGAQINMAGGLTASTLAAQQARQATEELKKARQELVLQEQALKLAAQQAAIQDAATARQNTADNAKRLADLRAQEAAERARLAAARTSAQQQAELDRQAAAQRRAASDAYKAQKRAEADAAKAAAAAARAAAQGEYGSINQLRNILNKARAEYDALGVAARNGSQGRELLGTIRTLNSEISRLEQATGRFQRNVGNYPKAIGGGLTSLLGAFGVGTGLYGLKQVLDLKGKISDELGDVQRILRVTSDDADRLYGSLKKLDTRTATAGLLNIATIAAKAGIAKGSIVEVTEAIDKLVVVLGAELGDADKVSSELIKIINVFGTTGRITGGDLTALGNGILQLAHSGVATAPFIVDFTKRIGGIAKVANVSLDASLGLAAGFEELGASAEVAGTATVQILTRIGGNVPKFAKIAGKSIEDFSKTLREKPAEALLQVAQGAQRGKKYFDEVASSFKDLEAKGVRVGVTLGLLGSKADLFREKIQIAGGALKDQEAINESFAIKNNTLAASFDKLVKKIQDLASDPNSSIAHFFKFIIDQAQLAIGYIDGMGNAFDRLLGNRSTQDISPEHLAELARGGDTKKYNRTFANAVSDRKDQQEPFIDTFSKQSAAEQNKAVRELTASIIEARKAGDQLEKTDGKLAATTVNNTVGYLALTYRLQQYRALIKKQNGAPNDGDPYKLDPTEAQLKKEESAAQKAAKAAAKLQELRDQANSDNKKFDLQTEIEYQKSVADNEKRSLENRLNANKLYYQGKDELAALDAETSKQKLEIEIKLGRAVPEQLLAIDKKLAKEQASNALENGKTITKILLDNVNDRTKIKINEYKEQSEVIEKGENEELTKVQDYYKIGAITAEQYEDEKLRIKNKYAILQLQSELELQQAVLEIIKYTADPEKVKEAESKILDIKNKLRDLELEYFEDTEKKKTERTKTEAEKRKKIQVEELDALKKLGNESLKFIFSIIDAQFENQKNALQDQQDALDATTQKEIEAVNSSTDTAQNKADKIQVINARAQAQKEELDRRQRKIDQEKARFDRLKAIGDVITNTAVAVSKYVGGLPFTAPLIAIAVATGAAQLGTILATPIPRYRYGTKDSGAAGPARINDGGRLEVLESPTGQAYIHPEMDAVVNLGEHYKVHPSLADFYQQTGSSNYRSVVTPDGKLVELKIISDKMQSDTEKQTQKILDGLARNKSVVNINYTWAGVQASLESASGTIDYLSKNVRV